MFTHVQKYMKLNSPTQLDKYKMFQTCVIKNQLTPEHTHNFHCKTK